MSNATGTDQVKRLQLKCTSYSNQFIRLKSDYQNLLSIATELVDALEQSLQNRPVDEERVRTLCSRLSSSPSFNDKLGLMTDVFPLRPRPPSTPIQGSSAQVSMQNSVGGSSAFKQLLGNDTNWPNIKQQLQAGTNPAGAKNGAAILQAMRWRLTRQSKALCDANMQVYAEADVLALRSRDQTSRILTSVFAKSGSGELQQSACRFVNAVASLRAGRSYLSQSERLLRLLAETAKSETQWPLCQQHAVAALQKLSLRKSVQNNLVEFGMCEWLIRWLRLNPQLNDYSLEYAVALLMNLSLRLRGKLRCARSPSETLQLLTSLLQHRNSSIYPYVNGTLYSVLSLPAMKSAAKRLNLHLVLERILKSTDNKDIQKQLPYVIKQLCVDLTPGLSKPEQSSDESGVDSEDDVPDSEDCLEAELEQDDMVVAVPCGEQLLTQLMTPNVSERLDARTSSHPDKRSISAKRNKLNSSASKLSSSDAVLKSGNNDRRRTAQNEGQSNFNAEHIQQSEELVINELLSEAKPVVERTELRMPADADPQKYVSIFGSRPKVLRTPHIDTKQT